MRRTLVALCMVAGLMSCIEDQKQQVARCELDAKRTYPEKTFSDPSPSYDNPTLHARGWIRFQV